MQRRRNNNRLFESGVVLLVFELWRLIARYGITPPVTLVAIAGQVALYTNFINVPWDKWDMCLSGIKIWKYRDYKSLFISTFEHADDMHLYYNMISFFLKGNTLECKYGSANYAILLIIMSLLTPVIYVVLSVVGAKAIEDESVMYSCSIGFSGVIFALKLITTVENISGYTNISGFSIPTKYAAWAELLAIHFLVPNASFLGHLSGILAGLLYMKTPFKYIIDFFISSLTGIPINHSDLNWNEYVHYQNSYEYNNYYEGYRMY